MKKTKILVLLFVVALVAAFFIFGLGKYFSLDYFKAQQASINSYYQANPAQTIAVYFLIYVAIAALSLPGAGVTTLVGGAIFGLGVGLVVVSFASTMGATK